MRSRWVGRLLGQVDGGGSGVGKPRQDAPQVSRAIRDSRVHSSGTPARPRICLGIGDGRVHRQ
ncbi:hypothetical protein [Dyella sp.]|uniref:hypothetical protein n=1 Tax=Dyella sp. TaxID=1869338 RepID=UPI002D7A2FD5|nr:hypothetical protein [Dyella sp.]HET7330181.1 hypothetical protein [Dyella sp.]